MTSIVFATNNQHKLHEVRLALKPDFRVLSLDEIGCFDELPETHNTLEANAKQKAIYVKNKFQLLCFADDTGLEVEALNNEPGVYSARYAGPHRNNEHNIDLVLKNLEGKANRIAQFRTIICWVSDTETHFFEGIIKGEILSERRGNQGFGYDSVFVPEGKSKTFAEMTMEEKNKLSHRAIAIKKLSKFLNASNVNQ
jgi:XTP/dITP diphosphohydrolase